MFNVWLEASVNALLDPKAVLLAARPVVTLDLVTSESNTRTSKLYAR
jgi:hypothetical protein